MSMHLYLVRWPNLTAALVAARSEQQLIDILDEIANPSDCTWTRYQGPIFLDFELVAQAKIKDRHLDDAQRALPVDPARLQITGVRKMAAHDTLVMRIHAVGETGEEMNEAIARYAFPETAKVYWDRETESVDEAALAAALRQDAMRMIEETWRHAQRVRSKDPEEQLALSMDASVVWSKGIRLLMERAKEITTDLTIEEEIRDLLSLALDEWRATHSSTEVRSALYEALQLLLYFDREQKSGPKKARPR